MAKNLHDTQRCLLFEKLASDTWNSIKRAHEVGMNRNEPGITSDLITEILQFNRAGIPNFRVYAKPGEIENVYGSDMDIFIETQPNRYVWYALQAKVLKKNNRYLYLRDGHSKSNPTYQWEKLQLLEGATGCKAYYLLYNSSRKYSKLLRDKCNNSFSEDQFGCSIVEPTKIKKFALKKRGGRFVAPSFEDIHPKHAQPWRVLVCCYSNTGGRLFTGEQLQVYTSDYFEVEKESEADNNAGLENEPSGDLSDNLLVVGAREAGWEPMYKVLINRSDNFFKPNHK